MNFLMVMCLYLVAIVEGYLAGANYRRKNYEMLGVNVVIATYCLIWIATHQ